MASRRFSYQEQLDQETDNEDYESEEDISEEDTSDEEISEEEYPEAEAEASVTPETEVRGNGAGEGEGEEVDAVEMVTETGCISRGIECDESSRGMEGQLGAGLDATCIPSCPICLSTWTPDGPHRVCCIPCGHVYGRSCLDRWIKHCKKNVAKCPQCNARFKQTEIINLYAPIIPVYSVEVLSLFEKNESLRLERDFLKEVMNKRMKMTCLEAASSGAMQSRPRHMEETWLSVTEPLLENRPMSQNNQTNTNGISDQVDTFIQQYLHDVSEIFSKLDQLTRQNASNSERISRLEANVDRLHNKFRRYAQSFDLIFDHATQQNPPTDRNLLQHPPMDDDLPHNTLTSGDSPQHPPADDDSLSISR